MKIIRGTRDAKNRVFLRTPPGGVGRMRCPRCGGIAGQTVGANGTPSWSCQSCGVSVKTQTLGPAPSAAPTLLPR